MPCLLCALSTSYLLENGLIPITATVSMDLANLASFSQVKRISAASEPLIRSIHTIRIVDF